MGEGARMWAKSKGIDVLETVEEADKVHCSFYGSSARKKMVPTLFLVSGACVYSNRVVFFLC